MLLVITYIVTAENMDKVLVLIINESERSPEVILLNRYEFLNGEPTSTIINTYFSSEAHWIP